MRPNPKKRRRGFSLLEAMIAGSIFLIGIMSVTALVMMSSQRRGRVSKGASVARAVVEEYNQKSRLGYDGLTLGTTAPYDRPDPDGRVITFTTTVGSDCNAAAGDAGTNFSAPGGALNADTSQSCCPGNICCRVLRVDATWRDTSVSGSPPVSESYIGFITKSCQ